jgi:hypothetical protein
MPPVLRWFPQWCKKILLTGIPHNLGWDRNHLRLDEISHVLVYFDHVASRIANADHSIM